MSDRMYKNVKCFYFFVKQDKKSKKADFGYLIYAIVKKIAK